MDSPRMADRAGQDRVVRVFVSSTFRDMQEERDYLVKHIFPELRRRCRGRRVEFVEVDLRWGVTEEQANRGEVLPICLEEIKRCQPYFIGLLGERYGWVPEEIHPDLIAKEPWLQEHLKHSVTELEILHGVLRNPDMAEHAFFYFRDPTYLDQIPPDRRSDFEAENPEAHEKLATLKDRIQQSGLPLWEDYPHPQALGELILEDLWDAIDQKYPAEEVPDPVTQEAQEHEAFALSRAKVYVGRPEYFAQLDEQVAGDGPPLVILGESGVGKSALLANWLLDYRRKHPEDFVFCFFFGASPMSTDYEILLYRLIFALKRHFPTHLPEDVPDQIEKLREELPLWLGRAAAGAEMRGGKVILILDGLNQLEDRDAAPDLGWLPSAFPPSVRVILSTLPGRPLTALEKRGWPTLTVTGLQLEEIREVIPAYLQQYRKTLDTPLVADLVDAPQCANPLYLKALLEELRVFGVFEDLQPRLRHYLAAPTVPALFEKILERLEEDYERDRPGLVGEALSLIWAARRGLAEGEILELLGTQDGPLPRAFWSPLSLALEDSLVSSSGLYSFFHDYLRQAVEERYLPTPEARQAAHRHLANFFEQWELDDRQVDELPWQLHRAQDWERLQSCLTDLKLFQLLMSEAKRYELMGYWLVLQEQGYNPVASYQQAIQLYKAETTEKADLPEKLHGVAFFFNLIARYQEAIDLYQEALTLWEKALGPEHPNVASSLNNLAEICRVQCLSL